MSYAALIAKWAELGPPAVDATAAKKAAAMPRPVDPGFDDGPAQADFEADDLAWRDRFAGVFFAPAVLAKLDAINAITVAGPSQPVRIADVMAYLRAEKRWLAIKAAQGTSEGAAELVDYNSDVRIETLDLSAGDGAAMLADLVATGLITPQQSAHLSGLGATRVPWWQDAGFTSPIGTGDLEAVLLKTGEALT